MKTLLRAFMLLALVILPVQAHANMDEGLYDPLPPEGSAFVRFVNAAGEGGSEPTSIGTKTYDYLKHRDVSPYFVANEGTVKVAFGDVTHEFDVAAGKFYTVVWSDDITVIEDEANDNRSKSQIIFYNLSDHDTLSLKTKDGKVAVIEDVASGSSGTRQINPVKVDLAVYEGDTKITDLEPLSLERSMAYSAIIFPDDGDIVWVRSTTNTTR